MRHGFSGNFAVGHRDGSLWIASTTSMYIDRKLVLPEPVVRMACNNKCMAFSRTKYERHFRSLVVFQSIHVEENARLVKIGDG